jgi:nitrite reductase/ring-hydroxylating ferredoxin subunit
MPELSDQMPHFDRPNRSLAQSAAVKLGEALVVDYVVGTRRLSVLLVRDEDGLRAFRNLCPHARWPLETFDGRVLRTDDGHLICAAHGASFHSATGACLGGPGLGRGLTSLPVVEIDNTILLDGTADDVL